MHLWTELAGNSVIRLRKLWAALGQAVELAIAYPRAFIGSCFAVFIPRIRMSINGQDPAAPSCRYAVYVTYDRRSLVADYVVAQVAALAALGYRILFISTSPKLPEEEASKVLQYTWKVLHRRNIGYDFGSYKDGIRLIGSIDKVASLILMNDSCYGPLFDLSGIEQRAQANGPDILGVTEGWWKDYHLQSYFLRIDSHALRSRAFDNFWRTLPPYLPRALAIRLGEIRFTQHMVRCGMTADVLCPYQAVASRAMQLILDRLAGNTAQLLPSERRYLESLAREISQGTPLNSMHSFWDVLIVEFACPFIKRNLLRQNPTRIPGLLEWTSLLQKHTDYDIDVIHRHLKIG
jgi:lipopolysaccharide biosynthesis protein